MLTRPVGYIMYLLRFLFSWRLIAANFINAKLYDYVPFAPHLSPPVSSHNPKNVQTPNWPSASNFMLYNAESCVNMNKSKNHKRMLQNNLNEARMWAWLALNAVLEKHVQHRLYQTRRDL